MTAKWKTWKNGNDLKFSGGFGATELEYHKIIAVEIPGAQGGNLLDIVVILQEVGWILPLLGTRYLYFRNKYSCPAVSKTIEIRVSKIYVINSRKTLRDKMYAVIPSTWGTRYPGPHFHCEIRVHKALLYWFLNFPVIITNISKREVFESFNTFLRLKMKMNCYIYTYIPT